MTAGTRCDRTLPAMTRPVAADVPLAVVGGRLATDLVDLTDDLAALESAGFWAVVLPFGGGAICARFANVRAARPWPGPPWRGPSAAAWTSSLSEDDARTDRGDEDDLDRGRARVSRRIRELRQDEAVAQAGAEAASADHRRRRLPLCRAARDPLRRWLDSPRRPAGEGRRRRRHRQVPGHGQEAGRDPATLPITIFRVPDKIDGLRFCQEIGVDRVTFTLPAEKEDKLMPIIDRWAELKHQLGD